MPKENTENFWPDQIKNKELW